MAIERYENYDVFVPEGVDDTYGSEYEDDHLDAEYAEMMPCDFSGYCAGTSCSRYFQCHGDDHIQGAPYES